MRCALAESESGVPLLDAPPRSTSDAPLLSESGLESMTATNPTGEALGSLPVSAEDSISPTTIESRRPERPALSMPGMPAVPAYVTEVIQNYRPMTGFEVQPKRRGERSLMLDWGVRISCAIDEKTYVGWICMGSRSCQREQKLIQLFGNTSKATKHLADVHRESSTKTLAESGRKRSRQQELDRIASAISSPDDSRRMPCCLKRCG
jgi:hypothetical protein